MKKISVELINEKVKTQEYINKNSSLKSNLDEIQTKLDEKNSEAKILLDTINKLETEKNTLNANLDSQREECDSYKNQIQVLNEKNQSLLNQHDVICFFFNLKKIYFFLIFKSLKVEYENLIGEAKSVIEESERQYTHLTRTIESEKLKKDTLQVEINMLEEKFEHKIKFLVDEYENKLINENNKALEKEKSLVDHQKNEIDQLKSKFQYDLDKTKYKLNEEFKEKINEYESKMFNLNQK